MPTMSVGGLASGLDTNSIIAQLTALEQSKVARENQKKESAQNTLEKFKDLETRLGNLQAKAKGLELPKDFNVFKANSNYDDIASISGGEGATPGQYELVVHQLATSQKVASESFGAVNTAMSDNEHWATASGGESFVTLTLSLSEAVKKADPKKTPVEIKINGSDTLKDIMNKINSAEGTGVKASIMSMANGENRLVLTAVDTGTKGFSINETGGTSFLSDVLGLVEKGESQATSSGALLTKTGAANADTIFNEIDMGLGSANALKNNDDKLGIKLDGNWKFIDVYNRSVGDVLDDINTELDLLYGAGKVVADINSSGEIYFKGADDSDFFDSTKLSDVEIKIGHYNGVDDFDKVKRDMGKLNIGNVFQTTITTAQNAFYTIDGMAIGSQSNNDDKSIMGTTFTLKKADTEKVVKLSLEPDMGSLADKIGAFVEEFNSLLKFIDENSKASIKEETDKETGKKTSKRIVGPFTGDSGISGLRDSLRTMFAGTVNELTGLLGNGYKTEYSSAPRLGIITNKEGFFDVDKDKLTKALNADFEGVRRLFTTGGFSDTVGFSVGHFGKDSTAGIYKYNGTDWLLNGNVVEGSWFDNKIFTTKNGLSFEIPDGYVRGSDDKDVQVTFLRGIAGQISNFVEKAKTGYYSELSGKYYDGFFKQSKDTYQKRIDDIQKRVDQLQVRVDNYNSRLVKQFSALERSMSNLQAQTSNMMSALSGINYNRR